MRRDVLIRICGEQYYEDASSDAIEKSEHRGTLEHLPEGWRLRYEEDSAGDMAGTKTELLATEAQIALTRRGALASEMVFSPSKPHKSLYETPYGVLTMEIATEAMYVKFTERGGVIHIDYAITVDGRKLSQNKLRMQVKYIK